MAYKRLWILIEGNDEERFFETIKPIFENKYDFVQTWQHAQEPRRRIRNFLKSIQAMNSDYFFLGDVNDLPCVTAKKRNIKEEYGEIIDLTNIIVVIREIERWYLAGLDDECCNDLGIPTSNNTDNLTKEQFNTLIPEKFDVRIDFMMEILKRFSLQIATKKNASFSYFISKI